MKLSICGGVGEHGRNCFYVETKDLCFLVDCGLNISDYKNPYPNLSKSQIGKLDAVFLTHSHNDHIGALNYIFKNGFNKEIVASKETISQIPFPISSEIALEDISDDKRAFYKGIEIEWGRTGHCPGAVWYKFSIDNKSILFSGDYTENSLIYNCDYLRDIEADFAVVDAAYGYDKINIHYSHRKIVNKVREILNKNNLIVFPVPKYGRGIEIFKLLSDNLKEVNYFGDEIFLENIDKFKRDKFWHRKIKLEASASLYNKENSGIVFLSDAQLKNKNSREVVDKILNMNGTAIATGTVYDGTYADELVKMDKMCKMRYPVHQNYFEYLEILRKNNFKEAIPYHSRDLKAEKKVYEI